MIGKGLVKLELAVGAAFESRHFSESSNSPLSCKTLVDGHRCGWDEQQDGKTSSMAQAVWVCVLQSRLILSTGGGADVPGPRCGYVAIILSCKGNS